MALIKHRKTKEFDIYNVPTEFNSVSDAELSKIKADCKRRIVNVNNGDAYNPKTLTPVLESVCGQFESSRRQLESDYEAHWHALHNAYSDALEELSVTIEELKAVMEENNELYRQYSNKMQELNGRKPEIELGYNPDKIKQYQQAYKKLKEKKNA